LAVRPRAVRGDERQQRVPRVAHVHVVARWRIAGEADGALETALAEPGLEMVANVLDAEPGGVNRFEEVRGELLVRRERRTVGSRRLRPRRAGAGMLGHRSAPRAQVAHREPEEIDTEQ